LGLLLQKGFTLLFLAVVNGLSQELVGELLAAGAAADVANKVRAPPHTELFQGSMHGESLHVYRVVAYLSKGCYHWAGCTLQWLHGWLRVAVGGGPGAGGYSRTEMLVVMLSVFDGSAGEVAR
jgi:hypothetical protein